MSKQKSANKAGRRKPNTVINPATTTCTLKPCGVLQLVKLSFKTDYNVCRDDIADINDDNHFYILREGKIPFHWLKERKAKEDANKPGYLPITISSVWNAPLILKCGESL